MTRLDRRALFATGSAAALLSAAGISSAATPQRGGHLRMALSGASRDNPWHPAQGVFLNAAHRAVFDGLTEVAADGTLQGELATSWSSTDGGRHWSFDLREDVSFHDGHVMTAQDVVASLASHPLIAYVEATSDLSVVIDLIDENLAFPFALAEPAASVRPIYAQGSDDMIGTGLYKVTRYTPGQDFRATRVDRHFKDGRAGWFDSVEIASFPDPKVRAEAVLGGYVDVADIDDGLPLMGRPDLSVLTSPAGNVAVRMGVEVPNRTGQAVPLDDFRAAERWWMAG